MAALHIAMKPCAKLRAELRAKLRTTSPLYISASLILLFMFPAYASAVEYPTLPDSGATPAITQSMADLTWLSAHAGQNKTVALIEFTDDPTAEQDLNVYRATFGETPCTTANGCFQKLAYDGTTNYPPPNVGSAGEIAMDEDAVSAVCPNCHIVIVEIPYRRASQVVH